MAVIHDQQGNGIDINNPLYVQIAGSDGILPTDSQSHLQTTIQCLNAVSIAASAGSSTSWYDTDGFDKVAITLLNDNSAVPSIVNIVWSNTGSSSHGQDTILASANGNLRAGIVDTKARYFQFYVYNADTAAHTMSVWAYLKA